MKSVLRNLTVLIVDDELGFREILEDEFRLLGAKTLTADCVQAAEVLIQEHEIDLILSDSSMPGQSGVVFLEKVRRGPKGGTPFILMTGFADHDSHAAESRGADALFIKPFEMDQLIAKSESLLIQIREKRTKESA